MSKPSIRTVRAALREQFGAKKYRITRGGSIHIHGHMPNSNVVGWYLFGWLGDTATMARLGF